MNIDAPTFGLGPILAITTGNLVCTLNELYELQNHLAGRDLMTHERVSDDHDYAAYLIGLFPRLAEAEFPGISPNVVGHDARAKACTDWVDVVSIYVGWTRAPVPRP